MPKCSDRRFSPICRMSPEMVCLAESIARVVFELYIIDARTSMDVFTSWPKNHEEGYWKPSTLPCSGYVLHLVVLLAAHNRGFNMSVEACLTSIRNQHHGQLAAQYHQITNEDCAGCLNPLPTTYTEDTKNQDPFFRAYHTSFCFLQDVTQFRQGRQATFPPWQRQLRCRYWGLHIPWQTFTKRLDLSLCTNSVSVSFIFYFLLLVPPNCNTDTIV